MLYRDVTSAYDVRHDLVSFMHGLIIHLLILGEWGRAALYYDDGDD